MKNGDRSTATRKSFWRKKNYFRGTSEINEINNI